MEKKRNACNCLRVLVLFYLIVLATNLEAATLSVGSGSGEPGDSGIGIPVSLNSSASEDVCGFIFNLRFDASRLIFQSIAKGPMADDAGKSLSSSRPSDDVVRVLVIGINQNIIGNGVVVDFTFDIRNDAPDGSAELTLSDLEITDCSGELLSASAQGGEIVVEGGTVTTITTTATSVTTTIGDCQIDDDCEDYLFCTGEESCVDEVCSVGDPPCSDDELYCTGVETCDEENDTCLQSGNPCSEPTPLCDEENDVCFSALEPTIVIQPDAIYQSRWFPLPVFIRVNGLDTAFNKSSEVVITPEDALLVLPFVRDEGTIFLLGIVMPALVAPYGEVDLTIITDAEEVVGTADLRLLPFLLNEGE